MEMTSRRCLYLMLRWLTVPAMAGVCLKLGALGWKTFLAGAGVALFTPGLLGWVSLLPPVSPSTPTMLQAALTAVAVTLLHQQANVSMLEALTEDTMTVVLVSLAIFLWIRRTAASSRLPPRVAEEDLSALPKGGLGCVRTAMLALHLAVLANAGCVLLTSICPVTAVSYWILLPLSAPVPASSESLFVYVVGWLSLMGAGFTLLATWRQLRAVLYPQSQRKHQISAAGELRTLWRFTPARWLPVVAVVAVSALVLRAYLVSRCSVSERSVESLEESFPVFQSDKANVSLCTHADRPAELPVLGLDETWESLRGQVERQVRGWREMPGWRPCGSPQKVAVIIPSRDGGNSEKKVVAKLHALLSWQRLHFSILVVQQWGQGPAMYGLLRNLGYQFLLEQTFTAFDCIVFHDPDLLPESFLTQYLCGPTPRHLSPAIHSNRYVLPYSRSIEGVVAITPAVFQAVNGFSNVYLNNRLQWDDFYARLQRMSLGVSQPPVSLGRFLDQEVTVESPQFELPALRDFAWRCQEDGLRSLAKLNVTTLSAGSHFLHTRVMVKLRSRPTLADFRHQHPAEQLDLDSFYNCYPFP